MAEPGYPGQGASERRFEWPQAAGSQVTEKAEEVISTVTTAAEEMWGSMTTCMRRYPLATFLTGIGLGLALSSFLGSTALLPSERGGSRYYPSNVSP